MARERRTSAISRTGEVKAKLEGSIGNRIVTYWIGKEKLDNPQVKTAESICSAKWKSISPAAEGLSVGLK